MTAAAAGAPANTALQRALVLLSVILATTLYATTLTIANVALPQMQGDLSASIDQIAWVLTFNIVATAIATPPTGWLAARLGRKRLLLWAIGGFTLTTVLCGFASSLPELILWRTCQGLCGAALVPLSQAITLDTFPREQHGTATALWGMGVMLGPILGPTVGGYMTELYDWRWVFFVPVVMAAVVLVGALKLLPRTEPAAGASAAESPAEVERSAAPQPASSNAASPSAARALPRRRVVCLSIPAPSSDSPGPGAIARTRRDTAPVPADCAEDVTIR